MYGAEMVYPFPRHRLFSRAARFPPSCAVFVCIFRWHSEHINQRLFIPNSEHSLAFAYRRVCVTARIEFFHKCLPDNNYPRQVFKSWRTVSCIQADAISLASPNDYWFPNFWYDLCEDDHCVPFSIKLCKFSNEQQQKTGKCVLKKLSHSLCERNIAYGIPQN